MLEMVIKPSRMDIWLENKEVMSYGRCWKILLIVSELVHEQACKMDIQFINGILLMPTY